MRRKLSGSELDAFRQTVHKSPHEASYDEPAWTTKLVRHHLEETYDVEYSISSCRRLLKEAGLSYQKPRPSNANADPEDRERFDDELKKMAGDGRRSSLYRSDQEIRQRRPLTRLVSAEFSTNCRTVRIRDWTCLLGAVTEHGEYFFARFPEYVTANHAKYFILALYQEFKGDLIVVLDEASYFRTSAVTDLAARDGLAFVRLPAYRPDLNPVEESWRQLESALGNRFFGSLNELRTAIDTALDQLSLLKMGCFF